MAAVFLGLVVLLAAVILGVVAYLWFFPLDFSSWVVGTGPEDFFDSRAGRGVLGSLFSVAAVAVLVGGLWSARRVRTGYWGRQPNATDADRPQAARCGGCGQPVPLQAIPCPHCGSLLRTGNGAG